MHKYLGQINKGIIFEAVTALENGNAEKIGNIMTKAQNKFDEYLQPVCKSQLIAPFLHKVLNYEPIQSHIYGAKCVGSGGDGSAQIIVKDEESQKQVTEIIERDLKMPCLHLTLKASRKLVKAVIPAAGFGTRLFPASKAIKKELFPIIGEDGRAKPVILAIVEEALKTGIEKIAIIVQEYDRKLFEDFFYTPPFVENFSKLSKEDQEYSDYLLDIGRHITLINQEVQEGFGHAVYCAKEWVNDEPFLLMLGDHLYSSINDISCTQQLLHVYERFNTSIVGLKIISENDLGSFGCVTGNWEEHGSVLNISEFIEKPDIKYAREHLHIDGMNDHQYLALFGQYILSPKIFYFLEDQIKITYVIKVNFSLLHVLINYEKKISLSVL